MLYLYDRNILLYYKTGADEGFCDRGGLEIHYTVAIRPLLNNYQAFINPYLYLASVLGALLLKLI